MDDSILNSDGKLPHAPLFAELRGKQSVRATFKLSIVAVNALSVLALNLGIKQKSLFDHLMQDRENLMALAEGGAPDPFAGVERVQKTFVISRHTLSRLQEVCRKVDTPRDVLVELSVQRLLPVVARERRRHRRRLTMLDDLAEYVRVGESLLGNCAEQLGRDDPVYLEVEKMIQCNRQAYERIGRLVEIGQRIEALEIT